MSGEHLYVDLATFAEQAGIPIERALETVRAPRAAAG